MSLQPVFAKVGELQVMLIKNNTEVVKAIDIESMYFIIAVFMVYVEQLNTAVFEWYIYIYILTSKEVCKKLYKPYNYNYLHIINVQLTDYPIVS